MPLMTSREAMEAALLDDPDDLVRHAAYADMLIEDGDPRGDFIRIQLQLEDEMLAAEVRKDLEAQSAAILKLHEREWLGLLCHSVYPKKVRPDSRGFHIFWRRGWIDSAFLIDVELRSISQLLDAPIARFLREITSSNSNSVTRRIASAAWTNLTTLRIHGTDESRIAAKALAANEFLPRLAHLVLDGTDFDQTNPESVRWLARFCSSRTASTIRELDFLRLNLDDLSIDTLLSSGIVGRLKCLELTENQITDDGALALAAHSDGAKLEYLSHDKNLLTAIGIEALTAVGHRISADQNFGGLHSFLGDL